MFSHEYNLPVFIGTGSVLTSGGTDKLVAGQLGIFDSKTYQAVAGAVASNKALLVAGGSWHTKSKLNKFVGNLKSSDKTIEFLGKDILEFQRSNPLKAQSEQWILGWDGVSTTDTLNFECSKDYHFKVRVWGEDVYGTFLRPVDRFIHVRTECCDDNDCATDDCSDAVARKTYAKKIAKQINEDPELQYFVKAEVVSSDYSAPVPTHVLFTLTVTDDFYGGLAAVQAQYPDLEVTRISRVGCVSTYEVCIPIEEDEEEVLVGPEDFQPTSEVSLSECVTCPAGFTLSPSQDTYVVARPLAGTENLTTANLRATYAAAIATAYFPADTFDGATDVEVVALSDAITLTGHSFFTGQEVVYADGGGTQVVGLTDTNTYYIIKVDANTVKLAASAEDAFAGTAIAIADGVGAAHTLTPTITSSFLSQNGSVASVRLVVPKGATVTALLSDTVTKVGSTVAVCVPAAATPIAWVEGDQRYKSQRTLTLTLERDCAGTNRLAELQAFYANDPSIVAGTIAVRTAGTCNDIYEVDQYSDECSVDNCLSEAEISFKELQSFEGFVWEEDVAVDNSEAVLVGIRLTAAYEDTRFGGCSFNPSDYYSVRPLKLEITEFDDSGNACAVQVPSRKIRNVGMATQSGEWVIRQFINANKYKAFGEFYMDPRLREVLDANIHEVVDRDKHYVCYFLKVRQNRLYQNHNADYSPEIFEFMFAFPEGTDTSAFELLIEQVSSQFGIYLEDRG
jgi:hypothetical protein